MARRLILNECWIYTGKLNHSGYGQLRRAGTRKRIVVHRLAYELLVGPVPEDMTVDHLCMVEPCFNPRHLEIASWRDNVLRGFGPTAQHARQKTCHLGHPLTSLPSNPRWRTCLICNADRVRRSRQKTGYRWQPPIEPGETADEARRRYYREAQRRHAQRLHSG